MGKENVHISKQELEDFYLRQKMPMSEIAKKFRCNHNSIAIKMKKYHIKARTTSESVKLFIKKDKIKIPIKDLVRLYKKGESLKELSEIYNCSIATIMKRLRGYGISVDKARGKKFNIKKDRLKNLYLKQKLSTYEIADKFNCCQATVWKKLMEFKIKRRSPYELYAKIPSKKELTRLYLNKKLSTWEIEKTCGYSRSTIHRKLREYGISIRSPSESHIIYPRKNFSGNLIEKAYIIGFRIGDLRVRKIWNGDTIKVDCGTTKLEQINLIKRLFNKYGYVWISKLTKSGKIQVEIGVNNSFSFLLDKKVPNWIMDDKKYFFPFLAGFIDAEGCIGIYNNQASLQIGNYDNNLLFLIRRKLNDFGIECPKIYESDTSNYFSGGYGHNQNYWSLQMNKKSSLLSLFRCIKPYIKHTTKIKALKKAEINILKRNKKFDVKK